MQIHHLPGVGQNLQDHYQYRCVHKARVPTLNDDLNSLRGLTRVAADFVRRRSGALTMAPMPCVAFHDIKIPETGDKRHPVQVLFGPWTSQGRFVLASTWHVFRLISCWLRVAFVSPCLFLFWHYTTIAKLEGEVFSGQSIPFPHLQ